MAKEITKNWYKSKTMWVNIFAVVGGVFTAVSVDLQTGGTITGLGVLNLVLRYITKTQIK